MRQRLVLCIFFLVLSACATTYDKTGRVHHVRRGDTLWTIADFYRVDPQKLAELNGVEDPAQVQVGSTMHIPPSHEREYKTVGIGAVLPKPHAERMGRKPRKPEARAGAVVAGQQDAKIETDHSLFQWPVPGNVLSEFGMRSGRRHDGVDIKGKIGDPIHAAGAGQAVFVGTMRGYGNLILLRHDNDYFTAYAHNSKNLIKKDQSVKAGQLIAKLGQTGRATGPHLHFEVRKGQYARNPLFFLPKRESGKK